MRIVFVHPNYHSGGAEIAGNWPPAWVAYLTGALKKAGFTDVGFIDAMTDKLSDDEIREKLAAEKPDIIGTTAITPQIYKAQNILKMARELHPDVLTVLGGVHGTFMNKQVLREAPWIDVIARGEGENIIVNIARAVAEGRFIQNRQDVKGIAYADDDQIVATPAEPSIRDVDSIKPEWGILDWEKYVYIPTGTRLAVPNFARGCPFTCTFCSQWQFWRDYRVRDPKKMVDEIERLVKEHDVGFFILADEEPTIHRKKFIAFCEELIERDLGVKWGINTRVTDILRDEKLLPLYAKAGLIHVSLGTEAAAQLKLERFRKETTIAENKRAIQLLKDNGIVSEAQFIVGLENETPETLEETYKMVQDWKPDMANWCMYTPWPFSDLFQSLGDKVEIYDFEKYNFVTPIIKPEAMERADLLDHVMSIYRRFYMRKAFFSYPWTRNRERRSYLLGCLKAFAKSGFERSFYDLGRVNYRGPQSKKNVDFAFDESRAFSQEDVVQWKRAPSRKRKLTDPTAQPATAKACGGGIEQLDESIEPVPRELPVKVVERPNATERATP